MYATCAPLGSSVMRSMYVHLARLVTSDSTSLTELAARPWHRWSFTDASSHCPTVWDVSNRYASNVELLLTEANIF
jgi:hypothetical protein